MRDPHSRFAKYLRLARNLGPLHAIVFKLTHVVDRRWRRRGTYRLRSRHLSRPVHCRSGTSDFDVFEQVFGELQYACLEPKLEPTLILDCGANVGYSAVYFLDRFRRATVIAIESDPENARMLRRNLEPFGARAIVRDTGVWSKRVGLMMSSEPFRDGRAWARQVREATIDEVPEMWAIDLTSLIAESGFDVVDILKMDIEGAEEVIFATDCSDWIPKVTIIGIELHSERGRQLFEDAVRREGFVLREEGELTVAERPVSAGVVPGAASASPANHHGSRAVR